MSDEPIRYIGADGQSEYVTAATPLPVDIGTSIDVSIDNTSIEISNDAGNPIPISDAGGSITVDGTITSSVPTRTPATTSVASSATSVTVLAANAFRKGVSIHNASSATLYLSFSTPATTSNSFLAMAPQSFLVLDQQLLAAGAIYGIWSRANGTAQVTEFI